MIAFVCESIAASARVTVLRTSVSSCWRKIRWCSCWTNRRPGSRRRRPSRSGRCCAASVTGPRPAPRSISATARTCAPLGGRSPSFDLSDLLPSALKARPRPRAYRAALRPNSYFARQAYGGRRARRKGFAHVPRKVEGKSRSRSGQPWKVRSLARALWQILKC
jgi:hypothetical protein